eukprot:gene9037-6338_t
MWDQSSVARRLRPILSRVVSAPIPKKQFWGQIRHTLEAAPRLEVPPEPTMVGGSAGIPALEAVFRKVESQDAACGNRGLRGFLTGYALANIADDRDRSLTVGALA